MSLLFKISSLSLTVPLAWLCTSAPVAPSRDGAPPPGILSLSDPKLPGVAPYDSRRSPPTHNWIPSDVEGESVSLLLKGNKYIGEPQSLELHWFGAWDAADQLHYGDSVTQSYTTGFDLIQYDLVHGERSMFVAGIELATGNHILQRWLFAPPQIDEQANTYAPGNRNHVQTLYNANVLGRIGIRKLDHVQGPAERAAVVQFEDSGDVYCFPYHDPPALAQPHRLLFSTGDSSAEFFHQDSSRWEMTGIALDRPAGHLLVLARIPKPDTTSGIVSRILLIDQDKDGDFDHIQTFTWPQWDQFQW